MHRERRGRPPFNDGKETQGLSVRISPGDRQRIHDLARRERLSVAVMVGTLLEEALAARGTSDRDE